MEKTGYFFQLPIKIKPGLKFHKNGKQCYSRLVLQDYLRAPDSALVPIMEKKEFHYFLKILPVRVLHWEIPRDAQSDNGILISSPQSPFIKNIYKLYNATHLEIRYEENNHAILISKG